MQNLAAYSFDAIFEDPHKRLEYIDQLLDKWLRKKGVADPRAPSGHFESKSGDGVGNFVRRYFKASIGFAQEVELIETAHTGASFITNLQIAQVGSKLSVYSSLSATPGASVVAPIKLYPRCPWIIRALIESFSEWRFAGQDVPIGLPFDATSEAAVKALCDALRAADRKLPIVVISMDQDELIWPNAHKKIAEHLIGLADVAYVDAESSWHLTNELGVQDSCYLGAVKLYWPARRADGSFESTTWRAARLTPLGKNEAGLNKFLANLRKEIMTIAALTMVQPSSFRDIQNAVVKERLQALEANARDQELDSIVEENAALSAELETAKTTIGNLQWKLAAASYSHQDNAISSEEGEHAQSQSTRNPPTTGETRFYKKIGSGGGVDSLVQTDACQHKSSNWKPAFKGDQAEKGLLKLEGRNDWRSIAHCSACTGGGRWRVNW